MLSKSSLNAAYPLAEVLAAKGWALREIPETPLAQLINASVAQAVTVQGVGESQLDVKPEFNAMLMAASTTPGPDGRVAHDDILQSAIDAVSNVVVANLSLARNIVKPMIMSVAEETQGYMDGRSSSSLSPMSVLPVNYNVIWDSPILQELIGKYASTLIVDMPLQPLNLTPAAGLEATVMTGAGRFDDEIAQFLAGGAQARLQPVWNSLFGIAPARTLVEALNVTRLTADDALVAFLLARRIQEEIPDGVNMDLGSWKSYASMVLAQAGRAACRVLERREMDKRNSNLVISAPAGARPEGELVVVGEVYTRWLQEGGSPEVLFGSVLSDRRFGYRELLDRAADYQRIWKTEYTLLQGKIATDRFTHLIGGLQQSVTKLINEMPEEQLIAPRQAYHDVLKERLTHIKPKHLEDIYKAARKLVCRVLYSHTNVEAVLEAIDASASAHPELDIREAALLATVDFVADWLCKLFTVEVVADSGA